MRNSILGGFIGVLCAGAVLIACGSGGGAQGPAPFRVGESVLAMVVVDTNGPAQTTIMRSVSNLGATPTVTRFGTGQYYVDFGFDISGRFWAATATSETPASPAAGRVALTVVQSQPSQVLVRAFDFNNNLSDFVDFHLLIM